MKKIAIYGAGGFGREVACLINTINQKNPEWRFVGFFDDGFAKNSKNEYGIVLGGKDDVNNYSEELAVVIAIASPVIAEHIVSSIINPKIYFPNLISPDVIFLDKNNIVIGKGNIISFHCILSCNVKIGDFNILNGYVTVGHDAIIGNFNSIMPSVKISGEVKIGNCNYFGVNSVVLQQISIGNNTVIGANSLILRKTKDGMTYVGNPASTIKY